MFNIFVFVLCYLIAAISPSIILCKKVLKKDIRKEGSKNAGTTNSIRVMGKGMGALVFILDISKVVISYLLILLLGWIFKQEITTFTKTIYILASVVGHSYPIYYNFKGGKGVAVFLMTAMLVDYKATLVCLAIGILIILITRFVSLGSMIGSILLVIITMFMDINFNFLVLLITVLIILYNHRENITRLIDGKENKLF